MRKKLGTVIALAFTLAFAAMAQTPAPAKHHAVFQMSEPEGDEWSYLLAHVQNIRIAFEKDGGVEVEVVFFGPGLNMLRKTDVNFAGYLKQLADQGVILAACQNSMRDRNLKTEDLFPFVSQVDSGVAEIVRKQEKGWSYIK